jgi:ABC-2 type transport system permease protein
MPILDLGYRPWKGPLQPAWTRWLVVASTGISLVWRGTWLKRVLILAVIPVLAALTGFAIFEQSVNQPEQRRNFLRAMLEQREGRRRLNNQPTFSDRFNIDVDEVLKSPEKTRHVAWSFMLFAFFRYPQTFGMIVILGLVSPRLISYDLRSRGYLLYLSRPLTPWEYVWGKACVLFFLLAMITTVPALIVYFVGILLSSSPEAILQTWDLPLRILVASLTLMLPTTAVALAFSSMTQESRFAGFAWFAAWIMTTITYGVLTSLTMIRDQSDPSSLLRERWMLVSPYQTLGHLQETVFGLTPDSKYQIMPWIVVGLVTLVGFGIAYWRVARTLKA